MSARICFRVVEHQAKIYEVNATSSEGRAEILRHLIEKTKPEPYAHEWHDLIATPFRYPLPVDGPFQARFRPPGSQKNIFYAAEKKETAFYEHTYHFVRLRVGLTTLKKAFQRTLFSTSLIPGAEITDVFADPEVKSICDPESYEGSFHFVKKNSSLKVIRYPSARDPKRGANLAVLDIHQLMKEIASETTVSFALDNDRWMVRWMEQGIEVDCKALFPNLFLMVGKKGKVRKS